MRVEGRLYQHGDGGGQPASMQMACVDSAALGPEAQGAVAAELCDWAHDCRQHMLEICTCDMRCDEERIRGCATVQHGDEGQQGAIGALSSAKRRKFGC